MERPVESSFSNMRFVTRSGWVNQLAEWYDWKGYQSWEVGRNILGTKRRAERDANQSTNNILEALQVVNGRLINC